MKSKSIELFDVHRARCDENCCLICDYIKYVKNGKWECSLYSNEELNDLNVGKLVCDNFKKIIKV